MPSSSITASAQTLQPGTPTSGSLPTWDDRNYAAISVQAGLSYALTLTPTNDSILHLTLVDASGVDATKSVLNFGIWGTTLDPYPIPSIGTDTSICGCFTVFDPTFRRIPVTFTFTSTTSQTVLAQIDGNYAGIQYGTYSDGVWSTDPTPSAEYTIQLGAPDDYGNTPATAGQLAVGGSVTGNFDVQNDIDTFAITLQAGTTYEFDDTAGVQLEMSLSNADQSRTLAHWTPYHPALTYTPEQTGTYYLSLSTRAGNGLGQYTITAKPLEAPSPPPTQAAQPQPAQSQPAPTPISIHRLFGTTDGAQFLTADANELATLHATRPDMVDEGISLQAISSDQPNAAPVFRFFNTNSGSHFLTADASERDTLLAARPDLAFEGVGFYEYSAPQPNSTPVYRYFNTSNGTHLFTSSATEIATIAATRPDLRAEGVAFYSPTH